MDAHCHTCRVGIDTLKSPHYQCNRCGKVVFCSRKCQEKCIAKGRHDLCIYKRPDDGELCRQGSADRIDAPPWKRDTETPRLIPTPLYDLDLDRWTQHRWYEVYRYQDPQGPSFPGQWWPRLDAVNVTADYRPGKVLFKAPATKPTPADLANLMMAQFGTAPQTDAIADVCYGLPASLEDPFTMMDGERTVINVCNTDYYPGPDGRLVKECASGVSYVDTKHNAATPVGRGQNTRLFVRFRVAPNVYTPPASYIVLMFDRVNYTYGVVTTDKLDIVWVLASTPDLPTATVDLIKAHLSSVYGIKGDALKLTHHHTPRGSLQ